MEVIYELTYKNMKKVTLKTFKLLPNPHKIKDTLTSAVVYVSVLYVVSAFLPSYSFFDISPAWFFFGFAVYIFLFKVFLIVFSLIIISFKKSKFPYQYQVFLSHDHLIYKDLQKEQNNLKVSWEALRLKEEDDDYFYFYIEPLHRMLVLKKQILPNSTISEREYIQILQEKTN